MQKLEIVDGAIKYLEDHLWLRNDGFFDEKTGAACLVAALEMSAAEVSDWFEANPISLVKDKELLAVKRDLARKLRLPSEYLGYLEDWNDTTAQSKDEVLNLLREYRSSLIAKNKIGANK